METRSKHDGFLILLTLCWATTITVLRALRWPCDWAEAHWLVDYRFGFIKRGLVGTLFSPFTGQNPVLAIKIASTSLLLLFCISLVWVSIRIARMCKSDIESVSLGLIFLTSPYVVMSSHLNGYYDNIVVVLSVLACRLISLNRIVLGSLVVSVGILVHETMFVVGFPGVLFFALLQNVRPDEPADVIHLFLGFLSRFKLLIFLPIAVYFCILLNQTVFLEPEVVRLQLVSHLSQFDFLQFKRHLVVPKALTHSLVKYFVSESPSFMSRITDRIYVMQIGIPLCGLLFIGFRRLKAVGYRSLFLVLVAISLFPLLIHLVAWDTSRIWTYPLIAAFIGVWGIIEAHSKAHVGDDSSLLFLVVAVMITMFNVFVSTPLMDDETDRFSIHDRILLYLPSLVLFCGLMGKHYFLKRRLPLCGCCT